MRVDQLHGVKLLFWSL